MGRGVLRWLIRTILYSALIVPGLINDLFPLWDGHASPSPTRRPAPSSSG